MDRNQGKGHDEKDAYKSPPARVAWIETPIGRPREKSSFVATREGGVDRNWVVVDFMPLSVVATREGGVDRNPQ